MGIFFKKEFILIALLIFQSGCSSYQLAGFEVSPSSGIVVLEENGVPISEDELIGSHCKIERSNGTTLEGEIYQVGQQVLTLIVDQNDSELFENDMIHVGVEFSEISKISLMRHSSEKTSLVALGATAVVVAGLYLAAMARSMSRLN